MNLEQWVRFLVRCGCFLLAVYFLGWGFTAYDSVFLGLILGTFVSFLNALYTAYKVDQFGRRLAAGRQPGGVGMLTRFSTAALAALVAIRFPDVIHIGAVVVGLVTVPLIFLVGGLWQATRGARKGGE